MLFVTVTTNNPSGDQDCWMINHSLLSQSRGEQTEPQQRQAYALLDARGIPTDGGVTLISSMHRVASTGGFVTVIYQVNPEFFGFAPSSATSWRASEWHRDRIATDPKRVAFIETYKAFNAQYQDHVKAGFRRQLDAFMPQPLVVAGTGARAPQLAQD